ncbi:MAG: hypothetical protein VYC27_01660 [Candidatus Thermoplasmatota archaeon]|nr:hypothetical protein [Candidatus Thermoplasmatota archaeon]MEE2666332.1 hypothetical protein [Candidatus Thermoplasmatota archaeon]
MADDVKQKAPLRGGRQRANHIQVHRIELGLWERDNLAKPVAAVMDEALAVANTVKVVRGVAVVGASAAAVGAAYVAWRIGKSLYGWVDDGMIPVATQVATNLPAFRWLRIFGVGDGKGAL